MAESSKLTGIELNGVRYTLGETIYAELDISLERFAELLGRDLYCPTLKSAPTSSTLTYTDSDGSVNGFQIGQPCRWLEGSEYRLAVCRNITNQASSWYKLPVKVSELTNDAGYLTEHQDISGKLDATTAATMYATKTALNTLQNQFNTLVSGDASAAIESFNEIIAFLSNVEDSQTLDGIIAGINTEIANKADKSSAITNITRSGSTFTATRADGSTFTFSQKDSNTTYTFAGGTNKFTVTPSGGDPQDVTVTPSISKNVIYSGTLTSGQVAAFDGTAGTIKASGCTIAKSVPSDAKFTDTTYTFAGGTNKITVTPSGGDPQDVTVTPSISKNVIYNGTLTSGQVAAFDGTAGKIKASGFTIAKSVPSDAKFTDTTYTFAGGTNKITVTPSGGSPQDVTVTPSISKNVIYSGTLTSGQVAAFDGTSGTIKASGYTIAKSVPSDAKFTDTTYSNGTGLSLSDKVFSLATSGVTAGSYGPSSNVTGNNNATINVPYITVDAYGRITSISNKVYTAKNTSYSSMSESEANTGSATTGRLITAQILHNKINKVLSDGIFVNYAGEYVVNQSYKAGAWVKFGGGDYIAKKSTSLPPIAIAALSSTALAQTSSNTYALMGGYEEYGNKDDWFEINPAVGSVKRISASITLAAGNQKVICSNSSAITITLPKAPFDGCEIWIATRSGNVTVKASSGDSILGGNKTLTSSSGWGVYIYDVQNAMWMFK